MAEHDSGAAGAAAVWARWRFEGIDYRLVDLPALAGAARLARIPFAVRVLMENLARHAQADPTAAQALARLLARVAGAPPVATSDAVPEASLDTAYESSPDAASEASSDTTHEASSDLPLALPLRVSRVLLPDSSGLPLLADLAALRDELAARGADPAAADTRIPVDLVVDHSLIAERAGRADAIVFNMRREFERNAERYRFLRWAQQAFDGVGIVPPGVGIVHQVHLETLARVVDVTPGSGGSTLPVIHPEFVLGGDSHTPMVNGLGVLGWGVGGVEAEAAMLGEAYVLPMPRVVGVRLSGRLPAGATTTDLVLTLTERLREAGVVGAIVEFCGDLLAHLPVPERATLANMAPEYGATAAYFPIDETVIAYLRATGRDAGTVARVEAYARRNGLFRDAAAPEPAFDACLEFDVARVLPCVAGPRRPQDRLALGDVAADFRARLAAPEAEGGFAAPRLLAGAGRGDAHGADPATGPMRAGGADQTATGARGARPAGAAEPGHGALAIAAITACTNTSNPAVMLAAGLLARKAVAAGLHVPNWVKTSLAPGSRVVTRYLERAGLLAPLEALGFHVVGYGCTTCSGKSGPIDAALERRIVDDGLVAAAVASSNRNFEGRIHRRVRAAYLASPPLVVAYAIAGRIDLDLTREPLGTGADGRAVFLHDLWPDAAQIAALIPMAADPALFRENYAHARDGTADWRALDAPQGRRFPWDPASTYLRRPPFFEPALQTPLPDRLDGARVLGWFGDTLTTDHISPAGEIAPESAAGRYLSGLGVARDAFNAFTMRRGNHEVMLRGTFANPRLRNRLAPDAGPGFTRHWPDGVTLPMHEAARRYADEGVPLVVIGGRDYGMGSSRDWAAKGPRLLGVRAVIAVSFERIHRANLIALGIVPLCFDEGEHADSLGLAGDEHIEITGLAAGIRSGAPVDVCAEAASGQAIRFQVRAAVLADSEARLLEGGGMFARVLGTLHDRGG
ncbi:MAG: aconitate hydratase AcnA [Burkholderiaceae bacterium]